MTLTVHCLVCDHTYAEPEVNLEECPHCFNGDMTKTVYLQPSEDDYGSNEWAGGK